jgi:hypothetical protein
MNRYQIMLGKFPTFAETYDAVLGYKEPWEYQKGKRYNSKGPLWFDFSSLNRGHQSIRFIDYPPRVYHHWVQGDWATRRREPTVREFVDYTNLLGRDGDSPNRNGDVYHREILEQARLREQEADRIIGFAESHETPATVPVISHAIFRANASPPLRGRTNYVAMIDDVGFYRDDPIVMDYPSSITIENFTLKKRTYISGGVIGKSADFFDSTHQSPSVTHVNNPMSLELDYNYIEQRLMTALGIDRSVLERAT